MERAYQESKEVLQDRMNRIGEITGRQPNRDQLLSEIAFIHTSLRYEVANMEERLKEGMMGA